MYRNKIWFFFNAPDANPGGATPTGSDSGGANSIDSIAELFNFSSVSSTDLDPNQNAGAGTTGQNEPQGQGQNQPVIANDPNVQTPPPMATQQPPQPPAVSQADLAELRGQINGMMQAAYAPVAQPQPNQQQPQIPDFQVQIPDELVQGLAAEDPMMRKRSLEQLGSGLGQMVLHRANQQVAALYNHISNAIPQMVASMIAQHTQMRNWHDEFYGEYKEFGASPQMKQFVANIAANLAQQGKIRDMSRDSHKLVAEGVLAALGFSPEQIAGFYARRGQPSQQAPAPAANRQVRPAIASSSARPLGNGNAIDPNSPQGIYDLLGGFQ